MTDPTVVLSDVRGLLSDGRRPEAAELLADRYPFEGKGHKSRKYTERQMVSVFLSDAFVDRYSGQRLVFPPVLRVLSDEMPDQFPAHPHRKMSETHLAYWDLFPTIDQLVPVGRGGADELSKWVTSSMARNAAKGSSTLDQIGWERHPKGDLAQWDGLTTWLLGYLEAHPNLNHGYVKRWAMALAAVQATPNR